MYNSYVKEKNTIQQNSYRHFLCTEQISKIQFSLFF